MAPEGVRPAHPGGWGPGAARRLSLGALGVALAVLVGAAWGTGLLYLVVRLGLPSPLNLALIDGVHAYVGVAGAAFGLAKAVRVGLRRRVVGVPDLLLWQRWISWSLLALYTAIVLSGVLAALPMSGLRPGAANAHLLFSVWALPATGWHVWHYRRRAAPFLKGLRSRPAPRSLSLGLGLMAVPLAALLLAPRATSQPALVGDGSSWTPSGLSGVYIDRLSVTPDGSLLLAAGDGLYATRDGRVWRHVGLPSAGTPEADREIELGVKPSPAVAQPTPAAGAGHAAHTAGNLTVGVVLAIAQAGSGTSVFVGTDDGVYWSPWPEGPYLNLGFPGRQVRSLSVDPRDPYLLWAASAAGPVVTLDGGHSWTAYRAGLREPENAYAVEHLADSVYVSDTSGVYRWDGAAQRWRLSAALPFVVALEASPDGRRLYATSVTAGAWKLEDGRWSALARPGPSHQHGGAAYPHLLQVAELNGRLYAAGTADGVSASADGGRSWIQLGGGLGEGQARQVVGFRGDLWTPTESGVYRYREPPPAPPAPARWWLGLVVAALVAAALAVRVGALPARLPAGAPDQPAGGTGRPAPAGLGPARLPLRGR